MHAHQQSLQNTHSLEPFVVLKPRQILTFWVWSRAIDLFYQLPALSNLTLTISWGTMSEQLTDCVWWFARNGISCSYFIPSKAWQVNLEALQTNFELVSPQLVSPGSRSFGIPSTYPPLNSGLEWTSSHQCTSWGWGCSSCFGDEPKTHPLPLPREFSAPLSAPKFSPPTYLPPLLSTSPLLPPSTHFLLTPSPKLSRAPELE